MRQDFDKDALVALIRSGDLESAKVAIMGVYEYHAAEYACHGVFESAVNPPSELIEVALKNYMGTHEACTWEPYHGYWVHSLSHFTNPPVAAPLDRLDQEIQRGRLQWCYRAQRP
jgi:hypothetical protein